MRMRTAVVVMGLAFGLAVPGAALAQDDSATGVSDKQLEAVLNAKNIQFQKSKQGSVTFYTFKLRKVSCNLRNGDREEHGHTYKVLLLQAFFPAASLETVNNWNNQAFLSRAVTYPKAGNNPASTTIECGLNVTGGVPDRVIGQLLDQFRVQVGRFERFLQKQGAAQGG
jgi:hypothetical protein